MLRGYLQLSGLPHTIINVRECITARHLLERIVASSLDALEEANDEKIDRRPFARTENLSALCVNVAKILNGRRKFVLGLDAVDKLREGGSTLIAALARLGETVRAGRATRDDRVANNQTDTKPRHDFDHDSPTYTLNPPLGLDNVSALCAIYAQPTSHYPRRQPTKDIPHSTFTRAVPGLHT